MRAINSMGKAMKETIYVSSKDMPESLLALGGIEGRIYLASKITDSLFLYMVNINGGITISMNPMTKCAHLNDKCWELRTEEEFNRQEKVKEPSMKTIGRLEDITCVMDGITYQAEKAIGSDPCEGCAGYRDTFCIELGDCSKNTHYSGSPALIWVKAIETVETTKQTNQPEETTMDKVRINNQAEFMQAILNGETVEYRDALGDKTTWTLLNRTIRCTTKDIDGKANNIPTDFVDYIYIKPRTLTINGVEIVPPMYKPPAMGAVYYIADIGTADFYNNTSWYNDSVDKQWVSRGLIHATKEAAIAHAKALLSFTTTEGETL